MVNDAPVETLVPPVAPTYQLIVPALAVAPNTTVPVPQRLAGVLAVMVGIAFTVAVTDVLAAVVQPLAVASTKYVVVAVMLGVVNETPVANDVPPVAALYQLIVPALAVAPNTAVPVPHIAAGVLAVMVGIAFTVAATDVLVAVVQPFAVASTK